MRIPRYLCALLPAAALVGASALPAQASANDGFRGGLKSAIAEVADLLEMSVEQNRPRREIRELDRALHELVQAFAGGGHHHHHPPGHHYGWAYWDLHGKGEHFHGHSGHFASGFHLSKNERSTSGDSMALNQRSTSRAMNKKSQGSNGPKTTLEPTAKQTTAKAAQGNEGGGTGQGRVANGTRILANPFDAAGGAAKKGGAKANAGKNSNAKNVGGMAGKKGAKQGQATPAANGAKQATTPENAMPASGNTARNGKNALSNVGGINKVNTRNGKGAPGSLVGNNAQGLKRQGGETAKAKVGGATERTTNAKNGPGNLVGKKAGGTAAMGRSNSGSAKAGTGNIAVTINGSNDTVNINLGGGAATKPRTNGNAAQAKNSLANNANATPRGLARNSGGAAQPVGNAKNNQANRPANTNANTRNGVGNLVGAGANNKTPTNAANAKNTMQRQGNPIAARGEQAKSSLPKSFAGNQAGSKNLGKANNQNFTAARNGATNQMSRPTGSIRNGASAVGQARTASTGRRK